MVHQGTMQTANKIPEAIRLRFQDEARAAARRRAASEVARLIQSQEGWTADDLRVLLKLLQKDARKGREVKDRFSPELVGQQVSRLVDMIGPLESWLKGVREAARAPLRDEIVSRLLADFWAFDADFVFPTAVIAALAPDAYIVSTQPTVVAMNALDPSADFRRTPEPEEYLRLCRAVRAICEPEGWPLVLTDAALQVSDLKPSVTARARSAFVGYTEDAVSFLRELPKHTQDPAWHRNNQETYQKQLRDPTEHLVTAIASSYLAPLDQRVAESNRPISILKKNDFGKSGYHSYYWFAFSDPDAGSKIKSVQLFAGFLGATDEVHYGLSLGYDSRPYLERFLQVLDAQPDEVARCFASLTATDEVRLEFRDKTHQTRGVGDLVEALRARTLDAFFGDRRRLRWFNVERRVASLEWLATRGANVLDDIGSAFVELWPLFEAARTGTLAQAGTKHGDDADDAVDDDGDDEDVPDSLTDFARRCAIPEPLLEDMEEALLAKGQLVLVGPPGTSKTFVAERFAQYFVQQQPGRPRGDSKVIYMHSSWAYEDFFEGVRPKLQVAGLEFGKHRGAFLSWVEDTVTKGHPDARYVLVLDEINRCDTAAVLGELLQLLENRGKLVHLLSGHLFSLPRNLFVIGTMNSADRSIGRLDLALRRRFFFFDLLPNPDVLQAWLDATDEGNPCGFRAETLRECNDWLQKNHGIPPEQQVGHALFIPTAGKEGSRDEHAPLTAHHLRRIVRYSVLPYVRELVSERGLDPEPVLIHIGRMFAHYWSAASDEAD